MNRAAVEQGRALRECTMATREVIKLVTGLGEPLMNSLLTINLRTMEFRKLPIMRDDRGEVCGKSEVSCASYRW